MSHLFAPVEVSREIGGRKITLTTGHIAKQANGAVTVQCGETLLLVAAVFGREVTQDFFPLTVDYRAKTYAVGRFPGGFFKREGRPSTSEVLTARLIDRPIRPLFPKNFRKELAVNVMPMSSDKENQPDVLALTASSAALSLCEGEPFDGPIGAVRVGRIGEQYIINPTHSEMADSTLDIIVAGTEDAITMVEAAAKEVAEDVILGALDIAMDSIRELVAMQKELAAKVGRTLYQAPEAGPVEVDPIVTAISEKFGDAIAAANSTAIKFDRKDALKAVMAQVEEVYADQLASEEDELDLGALKKAFGLVLRDTIRNQILDERTRYDGRALDGIRDIDIQIGYLPRAHGSVVFTRGETQAIVVATLGTQRNDTQRVDGLIEPYEKRFFLHYNFPAFCVGEAWPNRGPKRREIGHGMLAEKSLAPLVPDQEKFPYTIRVVSEVTESNGSSSMASVCGGTLALMDAGVPIARPVAGIAMGLIKQGEKYAVLSDISGTEDHEGDMDFKVAGTQVGITGLQMDIKVKGLSTEIMREALEQAREGRLSILRTMLSALDRPRTGVSQWAPRLVQIAISSDKIGAVIGPGGKVIRRLQEETGCGIDIDDAAGFVLVSGGPEANIDACVEMVRGIIAVAEVDKVYTGPVTSIRDFGAFVEILPGQEGLLHISEVANGFVDKVSDHLSVGDVIDVKVIEVNEGKIRLSRKVLLPPPTEEEAAAAAAAAAARRSEGGGRGDSRGGSRGGRGGRGGRGDGRGDGRRGGGRSRGDSRSSNRTDAPESTASEDHVPEKGQADTPAEQGESQGAPAAADKAEAAPAS